MNLEHVAIWASDIEVLKAYYIKYFGGVPNNKYVNSKKQFESYFLTFDSGARLELMAKPSIPKNLNDTVTSEYLGIIHLAFGVDTMKEVDEKAKELAENGFQILDGPRKTGDGYYEFVTLDPEKNRLEVTAIYKD